VTGQAAVAAGSRDTAAAAVRVLEQGGNAYDAVVAAGFAAAVAEPGLCSLGGGGFLLAAPANGSPTVVDFFVDAPGRGRAVERLQPSFQPVTLRFEGTHQEFHAGWGSVAVPGCLDGWLHVHRRLGRLPLADVVAPARRLARDGTRLDDAQAAVLALLTEVVTLSPDGRALFAPEGRVLAAGEVFRNPDLADLLDDVACGRVTRFADLSDEVQAAADRAGAALSGDDLRAYEVVERPPLRAPYRDATLLTNPPPSFGGPLVLEALSALATGPPLDDTAASMLRLAEALVAMSERHLAAPASVRGTTHVSVVDADGDLAAMTVSNGSCSGVFVPGTGVQLNNVMGEADLHPRGFTATPPGTRVGSMMAPTVVQLADGSRVALGAGGSERIRSSLARVLVELVDGRSAPAGAVDAPRLHWDRTALQVEPGLPAEALAALARRWPVNAWDVPAFYFGGVHAVRRRPDGTADAAADRRRGGAAVVLSTDGAPEAHPVSDH
jgi:gamma-glutamyltranspeptidase/glutathione hydrolase